MPLDPETILTIDKARINGAEPSAIHEALERAGHDADRVVQAYASTPLADGRQRGQVNHGDPAEWAS